MALEQDYLAGMHGNTHLPVIVGIQQRFELTGQDEFRDMASFFFNLVNSTRCAPRTASSAPHPSDVAAAGPLVILRMGSPNIGRTWRWVR